MLTGYQIRGTNTVENTKFDFGHPYDTVEDAVAAIDTWKTINPNKQVNHNGDVVFAWNRLNVFYRDENGNVDETTSYHEDTEP